MTEMKFLSYRLYFTGAITLAIWALLLWNYHHGGVPSHHLLHRKNLPEVSDWWSGLLLPLLTLFLTYRTQSRLFRHNKNKTSPLKFPKKIVYCFLSSLLYGILLSLLFYFGYSKITGYLFAGIIFIALFFPIYKSECLLGFVLGLTFTFGAVISTTAGIIFISIGAILYLYVRRGLIFIFKKSRSLIPSQRKTISIFILTSSFISFDGYSQKQVAIKVQVKGENQKPLAQSISRAGFKDR